MLISHVRKEVSHSDWLFVCKLKTKGLFTWRWRTPDRWGNPLRWGKKNNPHLHAILQPHHLGVHFLKIIEGSLSTKTRKMMANHVFWWLMLFYTRLPLLLQPPVLSLSIPLIMIQSYRQSEFCANSVPRIRPRLGRLLHLETFPWQNLTPAKRVTRSGRPGYPPWRVTPPIM